MMDFETLNQVTLENTSPFSLAKKSTIKEDPQFQTPKQQGYYPSLSKGDPEARALQNFISSFIDAGAVVVGDMKWDPTSFVGGPKATGEQPVAWLDEVTDPLTEAPFKQANQTLRYLITVYNYWPGNLNTSVFDSLEEMQKRLSSVADKLGLYGGKPFTDDIREVMQAINNRRTSQGASFSLTEVDKTPILNWVHEYDTFTGISLHELHTQLGLKFEGRSIVTTPSGPRKASPVMNTTDYALMLGLPLGAAGALAGLYWPGGWNKVQNAKNSGRWKAGFALATIIMCLGTIPIYRLILGIKEGKVLQMENME